MKSFLEEVAEDLMNKLGKDLEHSALIFVNKRPLVFIQKYLSDLKDEPSWAPYLFTIQEFFDLSSRLKVADAYTQFFCLWEAYKEILPPKEKEFIRVDQFYRTGLSLLADFNQLDEELIPVSVLYEDLRDRAEIDKLFGELDEEQVKFLENFWSSFSKDKKSQVQENFIKMWNRMPLLYTRFHENLESRGLTTQGMQYRKLGQGEEDQPDFLEKFKKGQLIFIGFNALSRSESTLFKKWQKKKIAQFYFDMDAYYIEDELQEAGRFLRRNLREMGLVNSLPYPNSRIGSSAKPVHLYSIQGGIAQAKFLPQIMDIQGLDIESLNSPNKMALVLADENLLIPVLQSLPLNFSNTDKPIPLNITMGYSLKSSPLFGLFDLWIFIQQEISQNKKEKLFYKDVEAYLSHPFIGGDSESIKEFRNRLLNTRQTEITLTELLGLDSFQGLFFNSHSEGIRALESLIQFLDALFYNESIQINGLDLELIIACIRELRLLVDSLTEYQESISLALVFSFLKKTLKTISIPLAGEPLEGLQIMGLMETRTLDFDRIYIIGAGESFLPKPGNRESLIPDSIRKAYGLSVGEDQDALSAYVFYRLFQRSQEIHLLYNSVQDENNSGEPSRFIRQIEFELPFQFHKYSYNPNFSFSPRKEILVEKKGIVLEKLNRYLLGGNSAPKISASGFTTFLACPLQFYYRYIAEIQEPKSRPDDIEPQLIGKVLHAVMEKFYQIILKGGDRVEKESIGLVRGQLNQILLDAYNQVILEERGILISHSGKDKIALAVIEEFAESIIKHDLKLAPFRILHLENQEKFNIPFPVKIDNETKFIGLKGIIDRIDQVEGTFRIVDYKTGKDSLEYKTLSEMFDPHSKSINKAFIQTLFYSLIAKKVLSIHHLEPHLYLVRELKEDTHFIRKASKVKNEPKLSLLGDELKQEMEAFEDLLRRNLESLFDTKIPFYQTENLKNCEYCPYKVPCGR